MKKAGVLRAVFLSIVLILVLAGSGVNAIAAGEEGAPVAVTGELRILYADDLENHRSELLYEIRDRKSGRRYHLRFRGRAPGHLKTGDILAVRGKAKGREIFLAIEESDGGSVETLASVAEIQTDPNVLTEEQEVVVLAANFTDANLTCSPGQIQDLMFTDPLYQSVDDLYRETSLDKVGFFGEAHGAYTIDFTSTDPCDVNAWADAIDAAARASGVAWGENARKIYVLPEQNSCGWSGLGSLGGNPSYAWIFRCDLPAVYAHELGHNLGMNHASTEAHEYGDSSDFMGSELSGLRQLNAPHQEQMGWRAPEQIRTVTQSGIYDIAPIELGSSQITAPQVLKVAKPDTGEFYYVSFRQPIGFDANLNVQLTERIQIHRYQGNGGRTYYLSALTPGSSFADAENGLSITHIDYTTEKATVQVQLDSACAPAAPELALSPASQGGEPGTTRNYTVSLSNRDDGPCEPAGFSLESGLPAGWSGAVSPAYLTLAPGESAQAVLSVTSSLEASEGRYPVGVQATEAGEALHTASGSAIYEILATCNPWVPTVTLAPASQSAPSGSTLTYAIDLTNEDDAACGPSTFALTRAVPEGWSGTASPAWITLAPGESAKATLSVTSPAGALEGNYVVGVEISDAEEPGHETYAGAGYGILASEADVTPPSAPTGLSGSHKGQQVKLAWNDSMDNDGVTRYQILRNGSALAYTTETAFSDRDISQGGTFSYQVVALDAAGNVSAPSNTATVDLGGTEGGGGNNGGGKGKNK